MDTKGTGKQDISQIKTELTTQSNVIVVDDTYQSLTNEFEQIRTCIGMYISQRGTAGAMHLLKEIFNNALDECVNEHSFADKIDITFDEELGALSITDNGRGIPLDKLIDTCKKKHTSTKFVRDASWTKGQAGRNGVGLTVTVALTSYFSIISYRGFEMKSIEFFDGILKDHPIEKLKKEQHGLSVRFIPSEKYLGTLDVTTDFVEEYFRQLSYVIPQDINIKLYEKNKDGSTPMRKYTYQGLCENINYISSSLEFPPVEVRTSNEDYDLWVAFSYDKTVEDMIVASYCNYIITTEGGHHETVAQRAICDFFQREARKLDSNNKFEVTYDDCRKGLILAVNCRHIDPAFEGQHKSKVSNTDVLKNGKKEIIDALGEYFGTNGALLRKIVAYLRQMSRIRLESHKIKGIAIKKTTNFLDDAEIKRFYNISNPNARGYRELLICEGDSAKDALLNARNPDFQAVFGLIGVTNNVHGLTPGEINSKEVFRNLITVLGCGVGPTFDITKLRWNRIIIATDADVDGSNITSLLCDFFLYFLRVLIDEGKIYKLVPPLYLIDKASIKKFYKGPDWLFDKSDFYHLFHTLISQNTEIQLENSDGSLTEINKHQTMKWLNMNVEYLTELENLAKRTACNSLVLEHVCWYKLTTLNDEIAFKEKIESHFNEIHYNLDEHSLYGSLNGEFVSLITDTLFMKMTKRFINVLEANPALYVFCKNKNNVNDEYTHMTIGTFLTLMSSTFNIKINQRYKGLGEAESEVLFATSLNPKMRKLIRLTISNLVETMKTFDILHGKTESMREKRRELLENADISYSDIDN